MTSPSCLATGIATDAGWDVCIQRAAYFKGKHIAAVGRSRRNRTPASVPLGPKGDR